MSPLLAMFKFQSHALYSDVENTNEPVIYAICYEMWPQYEAKLIYEIIFITVLFILPFVIMSIAFITIRKRLWITKTSNEDVSLKLNATNIENNNKNDDNKCNNNLDADKNNTNNGDEFAYSNVTVLSNKQKSKEQSDLTTFSMFQSNINSNNEISQLKIKVLKGVNLV